MRAACFVVSLLACLGAPLPLGAEPAEAPRLALEVAAQPHGHGGLKLSAVLKNAGGGSLTVFVPERFGDNDFPGWRIVGADGATFAPYQPPYQSMWTEGDQGSLVTLPAGQVWRVDHDVSLFLATGGAGGTAVGDAANLTPLPLPPGRYTIHAWHEHARAEIPVGKPMFETTTRAVKGLWTGKVEAAPVTLDVPRPPVVSLVLDAPRDVVPDKPYLVTVVVRNDTSAAATLEGSLMLRASTKPHGTVAAEVPLKATSGAPAQEKPVLTLQPGAEERWRVDLTTLDFRGGRRTPGQALPLVAALGRGIFHLEADVVVRGTEQRLASNGLWRYVVLPAAQAR